ncbi:MAG TPA: MarR family transcriptional regulator [Novosphingobium sp.]|nr:MarR family transcriptional regulator [Novosphingobium sp.]
MDNPFEDYPGYLLRRAAGAKLAHLSRRLEPLGVLVTEASVIVMIAHNPGVSQAECGRLLAVQRTNMNPIVRRMIERGWIAVHKGRGRAQGLSMTPVGQELAAAIETVFVDHENWIMAAVPDALRPHVMPILRALRLAEDREDETPLPDPASA